MAIPRLASAQEEKPMVYYVGNMGVAIVKNDSVILIDALHDYYDVYYLPSDTTILKKLNNQRRPFQKLMAITATHQHNDHFDDTLISQLAHAARTRVILGKQPAGKLTGISSGQLSVIDQAGTIKLSHRLTITLKNVGHSGARHQAIENYRVDVTWGTHRFVHFGDATPNAQSFSGLAPGADVAIVPYWFCFDAKDLQLLEAQKFKTIIATHIDPSRNEVFGKSNTEIIAFKTYGQYFRLK